ncbi:protein phosphatase PPM2, putative [Plasmodium vivax]|uniref:protein-serine/threonine phosphatase n=2 Tax=Plasmodium vivax TaxID=5855 RepID=A0A1G4HD74_PLAVI|nr:protein phosphatase 2C [Plasmodium vivax North Korean]SCO72871.1 protein phosphatase PPM2, putative [Plasmodium vivax]VUZ96066.1 protein phosphatase PPM2, putative [Plasmodium vivax]
MGAYLSAPKTNKESLDGGNLELDPSRYGLSCMQGWRKNMEDSHICYNNLKLNEIEEDVSIYGVFDGHGGPNVSKWISYNFRRIFLRCIKEASEELTKKNLDKSKNYKLKLIKLTLEKTFLKLDEEMLLTENQEKLKKYSVPTQENEEESDTRENYLYSILNDIISKNISIKAIEKDGKRCLQVVYNKDGNPVEEGNAESSTTLADEENNKSPDLIGSTDSIVKEEDEEEDNEDDEDGDEAAEKEAAKEEGANKDAVKKESCKEGGSAQEGNNKTLKKDDEISEGLTADGGEEKGALKGEIEKGEKTEDDEEQNSGSTEEKTDAEEKNKEANVAEGKPEVDTNKAISTGSGGENKGKAKDEDGKEHADGYADNGESAETNAKRLKKGMNDYSSNEKESNHEEDLSDGASGSTCEPVVKAELTYDNLKCMEEAAAKEAKNNGANGNLPGFDESALRIYEKGSSSSEEGFSYDEAVTNVIDNNISSNTDASNEADDCNGLYSSDELRLFENYYSNDYEDNIAYSCGSTALVAVILKGYLIVANAGDSRAIVCFNGNSLGMSTDHKPHLQEEEARIKKAGGYISNGRVDGNLNLTRAIGDLHYKRDPFLPQKDQKISAFPEVTCVTLTPEDEFLFLACDGIWDCKDGQDVVGFVKTRLEKFEEPTSDETVIDSTDNTNENATTTITTNENIVNSMGSEEKDKSKELEQNEVSKEKKNAEGAGAGPSIGKDKHNKTTAKGTNSNDEGVENGSEKKKTKEEGGLSEDAHGEDDDEEDDEDDEDEESASRMRTHDGLEMDRYDEDDTKFDSAPVIVRKKFEKFNKLSQICEELCDECLSNNYKENDGIGCDNMTCLIVQYNPIYKIHTEKKFLNIDDIE